MNPKSWPLLTSHPLTSPLKEVSLRNMLEKLVPLLTSQPLRLPLKRLHSLNVFSKLVTPETSGVSVATRVIFEQPLKALFIEVHVMVEPHWSMLVSLVSSLVLLKLSVSKFPLPEMAFRTAIWMTPLGYPAPPLKAALVTSISIDPV